MRVRAIELDENELPETITVTMGVDEAGLIATLVGKGNGEVNYSIYSGLTGGLFNRFWENGVQGFLDGDDA